MNDEMKIYEATELKERLESAIRIRDVTTFEERVFMEDADPVIKSKSWLSVIIEHFLKLAYCSNELILEQNYKNWTKSIENSRESIDSSMSKKNRKKLILYLEVNIDDIYLEGVERYKKALKKNKYLMPKTKTLPKESPWKAEELIEANKFQKIVDKLPDTTEYSKELWKYAGDEMELDDD